MAYDERLAQRIRAAFQGKPQITERKMFGGIAFLSKGHMFVGVTGSSLMARVGRELYAESLRRQHVRPMDFTGKPMRGYVFVAPEGTKSAAQLRFWLDLCERHVASLPPKAAP